MHRRSSEADRQGLPTKREHATSDNNIYVPPVSNSEPEDKDKLYQTPAIEDLEGQAPEDETFVGPQLSIGTIIAYSFYAICSPTAVLHRHPKGGYHWLDIFRVVSFWGLLMSGIFIIELIGRMRMYEIESFTSFLMEDSLHYNTDLLESSSREEGIGFFPQVKEESQLKTWIATNKVQTNGNKYTIGCDPMSWANQTSQEYFYLFKDLQENYEWSEYEGELQELVKGENAPSLLLICQQSDNTNLKYIMDSKLISLRKRGARIAYFTYELQAFNNYNPVYLRKMFGNIDVMLSPYAYRINRLFASIIKYMDSDELPRLVWIPHSTNSDFTRKVLNSSPVNKAVLSGAHNQEVYPLRNWLYNYQEQHPELLTYVDPAEEKSKDQSLPLIYRDHLIGITTTSVYQDLLPEIFEIVSTGALLVVNDDLKDMLTLLGLIDMEHYVSFDPLDPSANIQWALDPQNRERVDRIRSNGIKLVREEHSTSKRAKAMNDFFAQGKVMYPLNPRSHPDVPCPIIAYNTVNECISNFKKHAIYHCNRRFCGIRSWMN